MNKIMLWLRGYRQEKGFIGEPIETTLDYISTLSENNLVYVSSVNHITKDFWVKNKEE